MYSFTEREKLSNCGNYNALITGFWLASKGFPAVALRSVVHPIFWTQKRPLLRNFDCGFVLVVPLVFEFDWSQIA